MEDTRISSIGAIPMYDYETQYFGFSPKAFCDAVFNTIYDHIHDAIKVCQQYLSTQFTSSSTNEKLHINSDAFQKNALHMLNKICDKLEIYLLENILHIHEKILLPEDEVQTEEYTEEDENRIDAEIKALMIKLRNTKYIHSKCEEELEIISHIKSAYIDTIAHLESVEKTCVAAGVTSLEEHVLFNMEKSEDLVNSIACLPPLPLKEVPCHATKFC